MKPKNFPEKRNRRRKAALLRLQVRGDDDVVREVAVLEEERIRTSTMRDVRTKKRRDDRRKR